MFILVSPVIGCVSISAFASLVCDLVGITSFAVGIKMCAITTGIKNYKSIIKKKKKKHNKILVLLGKVTLNTIEVLISKGLMKFKKEIKHSVFCRVHYIKTMETYCFSCKKNSASNNSSFRKTKQNR